MDSSWWTKPETSPKPKDYRDRYQMLGTYTVIDPKGNQMHFTYASPGAAAYYRRNNKFADGTVLVKEILGTDHAQMTTGNAKWATDVKVWFVLIKDSQGRYPNNPLVGRRLGLGTIQIRRTRLAMTIGVQRSEQRQRRISRIPPCVRGKL